MRWIQFPAILSVYTYGGNGRELWNDLYVCWMYDMTLVHDHENDIGAQISYT